MKMIFRLCLSSPGCTGFTHYAKAGGGGECRLWSDCSSCAAVAAPPGAPISSWRVRVNGKAGVEGLITPARVQRLLGGIP